MTRHSMKPLVRSAAVAATLFAGDIAMAASPEDNIKVVQDFFAAYGANDLDGIAAVMDENVKWHIPGRHPLSGTKNGRDEVLAFFGQLGVAGFKADPIYFGASEQYVVDIHRGWSNAKGKPNVDTTWALLYRVENGKIVEATNLSADQDAANTFFWSQYSSLPIASATNKDDKDKQAMTQEIGNAVTRFFAAIDGRDWAGAEALMQAPFHLDYSSFGGGDAADLAPADILAGWQKFLPGFDATQHILGPLDIEQDGDKARVKASVIASHFLADAKDAPNWTVHGDYDLGLSQTEQGWILSSLIFKFKYQSGNTELPAMAQQRAAK